ncbi:uncharacterized protein LOC115641559 isoform X2 [Gopherus evgoodei]|uniref:uncharacterized protein LOC115641559 isoform X2 n=1 Tax=Gopherus evgoodei TaxID=1825980 RepID=UPI0011CF2826|nr:uncharacterized protein LOC115641559 isoform X2 [Gopherus evgoodei]
MDLGAEPRSPGYKELISPNDISGAHYGPEQEVRDEAPSRAQRGARRNLLELQRRRIRPGCRLPAEAPEDKAEVPSGIGDLVLAAELMEMAGVSPCYAQPWGGTQLAVQHDHGAYGVPQEPAVLGRMVRELQETVHRQSQLLQSLQEALAASQERCQELQVRGEALGGTVLQGGGMGIIAGGTLPIPHPRVSRIPVPGEGPLDTQPLCPTPDELGEGSPDTQPHLHSSARRGVPGYSAPVPHPRWAGRGVPGYPAPVPHTRWAGEGSPDTQPLCPTPDGPGEGSLDTQPHPRVSRIPVPGEGSLDTQPLRPTPDGLGEGSLDTQLRLWLCVPQERSASECWALVSELGQRIVALEAENRNLRCEREQLESQTQGLREELERSRGTVLHISHKLKEQGGRGRQGRFCLASVRGDGKWLRFYTGFGSAQRLAAFLAFLTEGEPQRGAEPGPPSALSPEDQLFLVLVRLRLGLLLQDLAFRFHLSETTASRYWLSWTQLMETRLAQVPVRCSPRYVERFEPRQAARVGGIPLVVLDCAQLCFEGRGRRLYALQGCALAAPSGFLAFCCSAALRGGEGAAGPGLPPFLQDGPVALSARQGEASRQVLSLASLADKALRFRFLRGVQPPAMEGQVGRAWAICCYLACLLHEPMGLP